MRALLTTFLLYAVCLPAPVLAEPAAAATPFIEDDYPRALAAAKAARVPLAVVLWARWCHSCRYMETVFVEPAVHATAARFRWAHLDIDAPANAAFVAKHGAIGIPAVLVVDPRDGSIVLARAGTATAGQLQRLLADGEASYAKRSGSAADQALAVADRAVGAGRHADAAKAYRQALAAAPPTWQSRGRASEALVMALSMAEAAEECATAAVAIVAVLPIDEPNRGQAAFLGLDCALAANKPGAKPTQQRTERLAVLEAAVAAALAQPQVLFDNRNFPFASLIAARTQAGDTAGADRMRDIAVATLEKVANGAAPGLRATAAAAFAFLASPTTCPRFLPTLIKLDAATTTDYVPPKVLASCLGHLGRVREALAANTRALARAPATSVVGLLRARARLEVTNKDVTAARASLRRAIDTARARGDAPAVKAIEVELAALPTS
jgi:tetratricopeptide (TPR) repeat protein